MEHALDKHRKRTLSVDAFCELYSVGRTMAYSEIAAGRLQAFNIGRKRLITSEAAESWLASYSNNSPSFAA